MIQHFPATFVSPPSSPASHSSGKSQSPAKPKPATGGRWHDGSPSTFKFPDVSPAAFRSGAFSEELVGLSQRVAAAEKEQSRTDEEAGSVRKERDKLRAQLAETTKEASKLAEQRGHLQARVLAADARVESLLEACETLRAEMQQRVLEAKTASCKQIIEDFEEEKSRHKEIQAQNELLVKERDSLWDQVSKDEQRRIQAEARTAAIEKEWDVVREQHASERLRRERCEKELVDLQVRFRSASREALHEARQSELSQRGNTEAQLVAVKESLARTSQRLAALEAKEINNQVVERVLLQHAGLVDYGNVDSPDFSPGAGRIMLLQRLISEHASTAAAVERIAALEQRLGQDKVHVESRLCEFHEHCKELESKVEAEEHATLRDRMEAYRDDCFTLHRKLEEQVQLREGVQVQKQELEQETEAAVFAQRAAQRRAQLALEESMTLQGRFEAERLQRQLDEAKRIAIECDAQQKIGNFKEDCMSLETKVQVIQQTAQRQIETFSDDCLVLQGQLRAQESRCSEEMQKSENLAEQIKNLEEAAEWRIDSLTDKCQMLRDKLQHEENVCADEQATARALSVELAAQNPAMRAQLEIQEASWERYSEAYRREIDGLRTENYNETQAMRMEHAALRHSLRSEEQLHNQEVQQQCMELLRTSEDLAAKLTHCEGERQEAEESVARVAKQLQGAEHHAQAVPKGAPSDRSPLDDGFLSAKQLQRSHYDVHGRLEAETVRDIELQKHMILGALDRLGIGSR